jgi:hypothetical protein
VETASFPIKESGFEMDAMLQEHPRINHFLIINFNTGLPSSLGSNKKLPERQAS